MTIENSAIYRELQEHLDKLPIGFPPTESGVELRILRYLFSPEEAEIATMLNFIPESLKVISRRAKKRSITIEELEQSLARMAQKGSINFGKKIDEKGEEKFYSNALLLVGMFENQLNNLTKEFIEDFEQYMDEGFLRELNKTHIPQLRTIPIEQSITPEHHVTTYDDIRTIIENIGEPISVAICICKQAKDLLGQPCSQTDMREVCFQFRTAAKIFMEKGLAREVTKDEALEILGRAEEEGLVLQPGNSQRPSYLCCCCGCCCEILSNQKKLEKSIEFFSTNYYAEVNPELCTGCETCLERCQMDALSIIDNISTVNLDSCIGCGLCILTCPSEAITLKKKEKERVPPKRTAETYMEIMNKKAKIAREEKNR